MLGAHSTNLYDQKNKKNFSYEQEESGSEHFRDLSFTVNKKKYKQIKTNPSVIYRSSRSYKFKKQKIKRRFSNLLITNNCKYPDISGHAVKKQNRYKTSIFLSKYVVNMVFERPFHAAPGPINRPHQNTCNIYGCQEVGSDDTCCYTCDSDDIFEVMKDLYNCYKKTNCVNCKCLLCGNKPLQGRMRTKNERLSEKIAALLIPPKRKCDAKRKSIEPSKPGVPVQKTKRQSKIKLTVKAQSDLGLPVESTEKAKPPLSQITPPKEIIQKNESKTKLAEDLTPTQRKNLKHKEKLLGSLVKNGLPLPVGRTPSERKFIDTVRLHLGLPQENETSRELERKPPLEASTLTLFEGKPLMKCTKDQASDPIPENLVLIKKDQLNKMVNHSVSKHKLIMEKVKHRKSSGLLTPLKGKTLEQKEKILIDLVKAGLPLPEPKTASEKYLVDRIQNKIGMVPQRNMSSVSIALENMTPTEKEIILKRLKDVGLSLPEPTPTTETKSEDENIFKALEGLSKAEKYKIMKSLGEDGMVLPDGNTISEKSLIRNVKAELGIAPVKKRKVHNSVIIKARTEGLFAPITDKPQEEKERIIRGLAEAELPVPTGKTASEKDLIKRIKDDVRRLSDAKRYKTGDMEKLSKKYEEMKKPRTGVTQNYQAVIKAKTCERACGSNKKNINLKDHTKFKVAFSDVPVFYDRPAECITGGKRGYLVDNKGIHIIVSSAKGAPSISREYVNQIMQDRLACKAHRKNIDRVYSKYFNISKNIRCTENYSRNLCANRSKIQCLKSSKRSSDRRTKKCVGPKANMKRLQNTEQICRNVRNLKSKSTADSSVSILVLNSEASLSFDTSSGNSSDTSVTSDLSSDITAHSKHCSATPSYEELLNISTVDGATR